MTAREEVLRAVRKALDGAGPAPGVDRSYRTPGPALDIVDLFAERVADYRATVVRTDPSGLPERLAEALAGRTVVVPDGFDHVLPEDLAQVSDQRLAAAELDLLDAVVTTATVAIAETGTIVLDHGPGQGRRALSLVPDLHVCVVTAAQVVAGVPDAVAALDPRRPQTWISGPSATSDIELSRVEGVHGPRDLHVILVDAGA